VAETADLKSLARRVLARDSNRDAARDTALHGNPEQREPVRQTFASVSEAEVRASTSSSHCLTTLEERCPLHIDGRRWQQAVIDGKRFLAQWGDQAYALGWTARDLFGLATLPDRPTLNHRRLSRYDQTGLIWLLEGRPVVAIAQGTAAIQNPKGNIAVYRKANKPAFGPVGDSLDDFR
jgi:hypothetical protein